MSMRIIRKALGLFVVDIAIIIGIFVLQFRTDSNIIEKIGNLQVTFTKTDEQISKNKSSDGNDYNEFSLFKNEIQASYNGINFNIDKTHPAKFTLQSDTIDSPDRTAQFINYHKHENELSLEFNDDIVISFIFSDTSENGGLLVFADLPNSIKEFYLPFSFSYSMKIQSNEGKKIILANNKKALWCFSTDAVEENYIVFSQKDSFAHYTIYDNEIKFSLSNLTQLATAEEGNYTSLINDFKNNLITTFRSFPVDYNHTEQSVVSYIAAMAEDGKYQQAVDDIPQSFKRSEQRTYLSAPYFNNLVAMNTTLETKIKNTANSISKAAYNNSIEIFTVPNIAAHLVISSDKASVNKILERATYSEIINNCSISESTGVIQTYCDFYNLDSEYTAILAPVIESYVENIERACKFENNTLTISENDTFLSVVQGIETGIAILRYGEICGNDIFVKAGRVIVSSYLTDSNSFDIRTLSNLYPIISYNNDYYPHFKIINNELGNNHTMWAWTCSKKITCTKDSDDSLNLNITFPEGLTHYVIFKGIPEFESIYIYNMAFRTDPRFETYNSSGYVYRPTNETLLIKSRHKSDVENIRMTNKSVKNASKASE
ncbi:MAG: hypothetical protein MJ188_11040 [Treponema sp.]|nr:hypothetical protein [Treponema sp.]